MVKPVNPLIHFKPVDVSEESKQASDIRSKIMTSQEEHVIYEAPERVFSSNIKLLSKNGFYTLPVVTNDDKKCNSVGISWSENGKNLLDEKIIDINSSST